MAASRGGLRRSLTYGYLAGAEALTHRFLRRRSGERDFRRVIVVAALGRNNGIASGARLQWNALRQLGVDTELLDVTPALRNPLFRIPHRPGSAYVFHAGAPQTAQSDRAACCRTRPPPTGSPTGPGSCRIRRRTGRAATATSPKSGRRAPFRGRALSNCPSSRSMSCRTISLPARHGGGGSMSRSPSSPWPTAAPACRARTRTARCARSAPRSVRRPPRAWY